VACYHRLYTRSVCAIPSYYSASSLYTRHIYQNTIAIPSTTPQRVNDRWSRRSRRSRSKYIAALSARVYSSSRSSLSVGSSSYYIGSSYIGLASLLVYRLLVYRRSGSSLSVAARRHSLLRACLSPSLSVRARICSLLPVPISVRRVYINY
jgi:hypothetical protein